MYRVLRDQLITAGTNISIERRRIRPQTKDRDLRSLQIALQAQRGVRKREGGRKGLSAVDSQRLCNLLQSLHRGRRAVISRRQKNPSGLSGSDVGGIGATGA